MRDEPGGDMPPDRVYASMITLEQLATSDPTRVMDLLGQHVQIGDRRALVVEVELGNDAFHRVYAHAQLGWLDESLDEP